MLAKVIIENGQKKLQALTADTGVGAPVGSFIYMYKKSSPSGYLYCDGSTFDETAYPALYQYLGTNVLPDYRECVAVGAEQNTTDTIATHDVYTEGEFKDDQLQDHEHEGKMTEGSGGSNVSKIIGTSGTPYGGSGLVYESYRHGTTTHGKQKAVFIYIKATSGLTENQQENVLNTINENNSYSTEEHPTGKKWIDGKPIYSKTLQLPIANGNNTYPHNIANIEFVTKVWGISKEDNNNNFRLIPFSYYGSNNWTCGVYANLTNIAIECGSEFAELHSTSYITIEYTKTTDN